MLLVLEDKAIAGMAANSALLYDTGTIRNMWIDAGNTQWHHFGHKLMKYVKSFRFHPAISCSCVVENTSQDLQRSRHHQCAYFLLVVRIKGPDHSKQSIKQSSLQLNQAASTSAVVRKSR